MSINAGSVYSELILNGEKYFSTLTKADQDMKSFETKLKGYGDKMEELGSNWTKKVSLPLIGIGTAALKVGSDFEAGMSEVQAISGATGNDLKKLEAKAKEMGATTKFSASESAEALKYMAMAGWGTTQMLDGLDGVMMLAASSGEDLGLVSDIVTDALTAFGMEAKEASNFADLLASASSNSNTNVAMLGESFKYVAPLFGALGYSAEDAALALGLMANAGIKGSQAGTSLRAAVTNLMKPTDSMAIAMKNLGISVTDANDEMLPFKDVMDNLRGSFAGLTEEQQAQYAATIFGKEAMSGMLAIINASEADYQKLTQATTDYNGVAKEMATIMQGNLQGQLTMLKSQLEGVGIQLAETLIPIISKAIDKFSEWVDKFASLDQGTQETIIKFGLLAAAIGPVLTIGGKFLSVGGSIVGVLGNLSGGATSTAATVAGMGTQFSIAGAATKASALLFNPWVLGAAAAGVGAVAVAKHLREETIPAMEEFDETISESTKNAITNFLDMEKQATVSLNQLAWTGMTVTEEMKENITSNTSQMADEVIAKLEEQKIEGLKHLDEFLSRSTEMSIEEKEEAIRIASEKYDEEINKAREGKKRIEEILEEAKENNRSITEEEKNEITEIIEDMKNDSISLMSESQQEQEKILENLKNNAARMTAEMMLEVVNNSKEQKDETIRLAEEQYQEVLKSAELLKTDGTAEAVELANNMIAEAQRQKDETIAAAEGMHNGVLNEIKSQGGDIVSQLDLDNGRIKSKWDELKTWFANNPIVRWIVTKVNDGATGKAFADTPQTPSGSYFSDMPQYARGTNFHPGGFAWVGEQGPEIVELPRGSKVYPNQKSMDMAKGTSGGITQNITINSPTPLSPSEVARKNLQVSRQLAMEWGV